MKNNMKYNGNTNNNSVIIFFFLIKKSKTPSDGTLFGRTSEEVFVMLDVVLHLIFVSSFRF